MRSDHIDLSYDYLTVATGSYHSYFGHAEWSMQAPGLKRIIDATEIRRRVLLAFEVVEVGMGEAERRRQLTFVIIGGGPTGVEMAGAIAELARYTLTRDFRNIDPRSESFPRLQKSSVRPSKLFQKRSISFRFLPKISR